MSEKDKQGEPKWCAKCENFALDDPKRMIGHCKINRLSIYAETLVPCTYFKGGIKMDNKVYALIDCGWDDIGESYSETENCLGIFTSKELVEKAANDYLKQRLNTIQDFEKEDYTIPETPITFEQLCGNLSDYYNHNDYYGARLCVYTYELDKLEF